MAHWIDDKWTRHAAVLCIEEASGSQTADKIAIMMKAMLDKWNLQGRVHVVISDNARSVQSGLDKAAIPHVGCISHSIQLSIKKGLDAQRVVIDATAVCRNVVTHFALAKTRLKEIQRGLPGDIKPKLPIQDVPTRWNSTYYMLQRMLELKAALISYASEFDCPTLPSSNQWAIIKTTVGILQPMELMTKAICTKEATLADAIPTIYSVTKALENNTEDAGCITMKDVILQEMSKYVELSLVSNYVLCQKWIFVYHGSYRLRLTRVQYMYFFAFAIER